MSVDINNVQELLKKDNAEVLDVRETNEFREDGYIEGVRHTPMSDFDVDTLNLDKDKTYYIMCRSGKRSAHIAEYMEQNGYEAFNLEGGINGYNGEKLFK